MTERKPPTRHPSTAIAPETVMELAYRVYLSRLEPPMTPEESAECERLDEKGRVTDNDAVRRNRAMSYQPLVRSVLRQAWDLGLVKLP